CYRFNRRFNLTELLPRFMSVAVRTPPMPYRLLKMAEPHG
ncbi:MAG: IS1595 family transposase, partial [Shewanella sp.]|nr:IS1595 family transposase [Shewanella sp.]NRB25941.1 IS1595 family transposase [Shewanella sp.]